MAKSDSLTKTQAAVLKMLKEGRSVRQIAEARGVSLASVYEIMRRLVRQGVVEKTYRPNFVAK